MDIFAEGCHDSKQCLLLLVLSPKLMGKLENRDLN